MTADRQELVDLVVFSAADRGDLLARSVPGYARVLEGAPLGRRILAIDGHDPATLAAPYLAWFDAIVFTRVQSGYYANIENGLALVQTATFLWLEDDWSLSSSPDLGAALEAFARLPNLAQIRWPKSADLLLEDKRRGRADPDVWLQDRRYSFNPHLARRGPCMSALESLRTGSHAGQNVEGAFSRILAARGLLFGTWDPQVALAQHLGAEHPQARRYELHAAPAAGERPRTAQTDGLAEPPLAASGAAEAVRMPPRRVRYGAAPELLGKALFASAVTPLAVCAAPISRQARAYLRQVWSYWRPALEHPDHVGPSREDVR